MYHFRYTLDEQDYFAFNKYHLFNSPTNKKNLLANRLVVPIMFVLCGLFIGTIVKEPFLSYYFYIAFGIVAICWLIFFKTIMKKQIKRNMKRMKKRGKLPYQRDITISFEDDVIVEITENGESKVKYSALERVITTEKAIYIYINAMQAILLPCAVFSDEKERDDFIVFISKHVV